MAKFGYFVTLLFIFLLSNSSLFGQEKSTSLGLVFSVNRLDFFNGLELRHTSNKAFISGSLEYGINRSLFQSRIFPKTTLGFGWNVLTTEKATLAPMAFYAFSFYKVSPFEHPYHRYHELYSGIQFTYGKTWGVKSSVLGGSITERYYSKIENSQRGIGSIGYLLYLGVYHEL